MGHVDVAQAVVQVADGDRQEGQHRHGRQELRQAQRGGVCREVRRPQRLRQAAQVTVDVLPAGYVLQALELLGGQARGQQGLHFSSVVQEGQHAVAGPGEGAGAVHRLLAHGVQVQVAGDAPAGAAEDGEPCPQGFYRALHFFLHILGIVQIATRSRLYEAITQNIVTDSVRESLN